VHSPTRWSVIQKLTILEKEIDRYLGYSVPAISQSRESRNEFWQLPGFERPPSILKVEGLGEIVTSLRQSFGRIPIPEALLSARHQDVLDDQREIEKQAEATHQLERERSNYLDSLNHLTFYEKVKALQFGRPIYPSDLNNKPEWLLCTESDLANLDASQVHQLIDWCSSQSHMGDALTMLFEKRHQLRLDAILQLEEKLNAYPIDRWLNELLLDKSIPIEHYPVVLTEYASKEWLMSIEPELAVRFHDMLKSTNLRKWKKVERNLLEIFPKANVQ